MGDDMESLAVWQPLLSPSAPMAGVTMHLGIFIVMAMIYFMEKLSINGWFGGTPILGNHQLLSFKTWGFSGDSNIQPSQIVT